MMFSRVEFTLLLSSALLIFVPVYAHECLTSVECPNGLRCARNSGRVDGECGEFSCSFKANTCEPRLGMKEPCGIAYDDCKKGMYCAFDVPGVDRLPVCMPQIKLGAECRLDATRPCAGHPENRCDVKTKKCTVWKGGGAGDACTWDRECRQTEGFYCDYKAKQCKRKNPEGASCGTNNYECMGFCARLATLGKERRVCLRRRKRGEKCTQDTQCRENVLYVAGNNDYRCNNFWSGTGVCVLESELLKIPGVVCNPNEDRCDRRRRLWCRKRGNTHRCVQESSLEQFCTPGSMYSVCMPLETGTPLECRKPLSFTKKREFGLPVCLRPRERVRRGEICNRAEYARCEKGTKCRTVLGIHHFDGDDPTARLGYCVRVVKVGKKCKNRFKTTCVKGAYCIKGKCRRRKKAPKEIMKYAGDWVLCSKAKCARGLKCRKTGGWRRCMLKTRTVKTGSPCYDTANRRVLCQNGYACIRDVLGDGLKRCVRKAGVDDFCYGFGTCKKGLQCRWRWENNPLREMTCYNPNHALKAGAECKLSNKNKGHRCGVMKIDHSERSLQCVQVGATRKCALENRILQYCNPDEHILCQEGLRCDNLICRIDKVMKLS